MHEIEVRHRVATKQIVILFGKETVTPMTPAVNISSLYRYILLLRLTNTTKSQSYIYKCCHEWLILTACSDIRLQDPLQLKPHVGVSAARTCFMHLQSRKSFAVGVGLGLCALYSQRLLYSPDDAHRSSAARTTNCAAPNKSGLWPFKE